MRLHDSATWQKAVPAAVAAAYAVFSSAWIVLSDRIAASVSRDSVQLHTIQTYKGEFFILVSSVLIFLLLRAAWSRLVRAYERARTSERRLELALSAAGAGVWETGVDGDEASSAFVSVGLTARLGFPTSRKMTLGELSALRHPDDVPASDQAFADVLTGAKEQLDVRYRIRASDGSYRWVHTRGKIAPGPDGQPRLIGVSLDVDEQMAAEQTVDRMTRFDAATGLAKPHQFINAVDAALATSPHATFAVAQFRISNLSQHLDEAEILESAKAVTTISDRLHQLAETGVLAGRLSTDTFAVCTPAVGSQDSARAMIDRVCGLFTLPLGEEGHKTRLQVSVGASLLSRNGETASDLTRLSGYALELADPNETTVMWFTPGMEERASRRNRLVRALSSAVEKGQIEAHYQPLIRLASGRVAGFEALARWRFEGELIQPDQFIPLAERFGYIGEIGEVLLRHACATGAAMSADRAGAFVAVNLSSIQLQNPAFPALIARILAETGLQPSRLELEMTETALARDLEASAGRLQRLRALGVSIAIDDFGTGYSSLSMLRALPFNRLKVDRAFVKDYGSDSEATTIADTIIDMCHDLKLEITAEGIEDIAIAAKLRDRGVEIGQGYCFSRPVADPSDLLDRVWPIPARSRQTVHTRKA